MCAMIQKADNAPQNQKKDAKSAQVVTTAPPDRGGSPEKQRSSKLRAKAQRLAETGHLQEAVNLLASLGPTDRAAVNDKGVCLMRIGKHTDAVNSLRTMVLHPGSTWMRKDLPVLYKVNFATSLALAGLISGCEEILTEINDITNPHVMELRKTLKAWRKSLPLWTRFNLYLGVEASKPVDLGAEPGQFAPLEG